MSNKYSEEFIDYCKEWEEKIGAFTELRFNNKSDDTPPLSIAETAIPAGAKKLIAGFPFAVKDNIAVKDFSLTCGSKLLAAFRSPYSATAVSKLQALGAEVIGKTNLDEFGMGSSAGDRAAAAVAAGMVPFALGSDTGGSVRQSAAFCGVLGLKPSYGIVSRFGLTAYASSLEGIGIMADSAARARAILAAIQGKDPNDDTSRNVPNNAQPLYGKKMDKERLKNTTIGILSVEPADLESELCQAVELAGKQFAALGCKLVNIEMPYLKYALPAYYTIAAAEASANLARFDGIRFGKRPDFAENPDELVDKARDAGFGDEVKLRILLGTYVLRSGLQDRYYLRAQRIRAGIRTALDELLKEPVAAILLPVYPVRAINAGANTLSAFAQRTADIYTCCANLAGLPALSFPVSPD
ncbi:MAG: Asp-tRNA(Asn)/Glu-tRNA(Gln) amidotransferase subunit GatA, partial [Treponema sp.]|nr:Asp-tRNA(Asn)/Glu-tRNA(Gln) amidotransferase subunit GatA [Treponema sp.]